MADALTLRVRMSDALTLRVRKADGVVCVVRRDLCADMHRPGAEYLASLRPERLLRPDAAPASGRRIFFLMKTMDRTDRRIRRIEAAYKWLAHGAQYVYEQMEAKEQISGDWVRNELMVAANAYQAFTRQVWEAIIFFFLFIHYPRVRPI